MTDHDTRLRVLSAIRDVHRARTAANGGVPPDWDNADWDLSGAILRDLVTATKLPPDVVLEAMRELYGSLAPDGDPVFRLLARDGGGLG